MKTAGLRLLDKVENYEQKRNSENLAEFLFVCSKFAQNDVLTAFTVERVESVKRYWLGAICN